MRTSRLTIAVAATAAGVTFSGSVAAAATRDADRAPGTSHWLMRSQPGDYIGQGRKWSYGARQGAIISASGDASEVGLRVQTPTDDWSADFDPGDGRQLVAGARFTGATRYPFNDGSTPGLSIYGNGRGCNELYGSFRVLEAAYDEDGHVVRFVVKFEQHCESPTAPALTGTIRFVGTQSPAGD